MFQYHCPLFNFSQILTKFSKNKEIIKQYQRSLSNIKERVMLDMRRLVRQTKETGELERKYDAIVFILAS